MRRIVLRMYSLRTRTVGQNDSSQAPETRSSHVRKRHITPEYEAPPETDSVRIKQEKLDPSDCCTGVHGTTPLGSTGEHSGACFALPQLTKQEPGINHAHTFNAHTSPVIAPSHAHFQSGSAHFSQADGSPVNRLHHFSQGQPLHHHHHSNTPPPTSSHYFPPQSWYYVSPPPQYTNQPITFNGGGTFGGLNAATSPGTFNPSFQPISGEGGVDFGGSYPGTTTVKLEGRGNEIKTEGLCDPVRVKREIEDDLRCHMRQNDEEEIGNRPIKVKREVKAEAGEVGEWGRWVPPKWREQLDNIIKMRERRDAPVDWSGCHVLAASDVPAKVRRYQILVSLMLSSQTKDEITGQAMRKLRNHGLTVDNVLDTPQEILAQLILPVGFWNKKADYILRTTRILKDKYDSDIPNNMKELMSLPGIGPKMSHLIMDVAWNSVTGIAVDTHVHRISHRLGWMRKPTKNPEVTRVALEEWLPQSEWRELNWLLVGFGQQICHPLRPECAKCLNKDICPSAFPSPPSTPKRKASNASPASPSPRAKGKTPKAAAPKTSAGGSKQRSRLKVKVDPESGLDSSGCGVGPGSVPPGMESASTPGEAGFIPTTPLKHRPVEATRMRLSDSFDGLRRHDDSTP